PRALMQARGMTQIGLYHLVGSATGVVVLGTISLLSAVALAFGFQTRLATIASWVLLVSLQNRNPFVYHSGDELLRLLLFWGCFFLSARAGAWTRTNARNFPLLAPRFFQSGPSVCSYSFSISFFFSLTIS